MNPSNLYFGRLAPSPTGAQHIGNARTFLLAWLAARSVKGKLILRVEDLDTPRTKSWATQQAIDDLCWLGLHWDEEESQTIRTQSSRTSRYQEILLELQKQERVYPCTCTRSEIESSASAPHESQLDGAVYPGTCSGRKAADAPALDQAGKRYAWRFRMPTGSMNWIDRLFGYQELVPREQLGDFVVARNYGPTAYQLAVVVDDHDSGITEVVRGCDLIYSTYRQIAIYNALGWTCPNWFHTPLVVGPDLKRLAKRHGDTRLSTLREQNVAPETILGWLAFSLRLQANDKPTSLRQLLDCIATKKNWVESLPTEPWIFNLSR